MKPTNKTVAVIGGGMAGLAAARLLCLKGMTVKLYETNAKLGGCCATTRVGGYTFNDGALFLALPGMLDQLFHRLELERSSLLPLRRVSALQRTALPDGTVVTFGEEPDISVEGNGGKAATATARKELQAFLNTWDPLLHLFADDILVHPLSLPRFIAKGWRYLHLFRGTAGAHLNNSFSNEAVRAAMSGTLLFTGIPPDKVPAASLLSLAAMFRQGYFIPGGGMGSIPETLGRALREQGGEINLNSKVDRILVKNGYAYAIDVKNQGVVEVDAVISTTSGMHTCGSLLSERDVPAKMARKARRAILSHKGFALQLGLSNKIDAGSYSNNVLPFLADQHQLFSPDPHELRWPIYMVPTLAVPELAPPGGSIVEVFPPIRQDLAAEDWSEERKEEIAAQAIERLKSIHDIDIAVRRILSPKEFQNDAHLYAGALYGLSPLASPAALFKYRSPIRALYQAGQTTWPGFGFASAGMSGVMAAEALIRDELR
ncbi:MAG: NAD(P)/FAD-dependent oxidoreductase [Proteobacteria bacterium]|nr:NAD(P)/FAD-dependent oxidoreductase [Pseudomonadota bacterium]